MRGIVARPPPTAFGGPPSPQGGGMVPHSESLPKMSRELVRGVPVVAGLGVDLQRNA
jgi:hypothetical protein